MATPKVFGHQYGMVAVTPFVFSDLDDAGVACSTVATHQITACTLPANSRVLFISLDIDTAFDSATGTSTMDIGYWQDGAVVDADEFTAGGAIDTSTAVGHFGIGQATSAIIPTAQVYTTPTEIVIELIVSTAVLDSGAGTLSVAYVVEGKSDLVQE